MPSPTAPNARSEPESATNPAPAVPARRPESVVMGDDSGCETPVKDTAEVATRETAAREHVTEELTTKRKAEVAAPETATPFQKQRHHDPSRLSPDGRRRRAQRAELSQLP